MTPTMRFRFSKKRVEALPIPTTGRAEYRDEITPGLVLRVTSNGSKTFSLFRRLDGRPARITLGTFPGMTVEQAQRRARELLGEIAAGIDPRAARRAARAEPTLGALFQYWLDSHAKPHKRTWEADQRQYDTYLKAWAGRRLSDIGKADIRALQLRIAEKKGRYIANKVLSLIGAMYSRAAADLGYTGSNPAHGIKKFPEEKRDRFLHGHELGAFFAALAAEPNATLRDYFLFCLLTGVRKGNALAARWEDIDFATGLWRIPTTKSGKPVGVPLVGPLLHVLQTRRQNANGNPWVFPSRGKTGHLVEPKSAWKRIITAAGLVDVRPHDLRRSLASWMTIGGSSLPVVGRMLGHTQASSTSIYARLSVDPVREAAEQATAAMFEAGGVTLMEADNQKGADDGQAKE